MLREVTLRFSDGAQMSVKAGSGETVLAAAMRSGVRLMHQCMSGSCGTCIGRLTCGSLEMHAQTGHCLLPSEIESGQRLVCLSRPQTDACIEFDYPSTLLEGDVPTRLKAGVAEREWLAENVMRLVLELSESASFDFRAGQYVRVRVPGTDEWRSYSMASTPAQLPQIDLLLRVLPRGTMSDYLRERCAVSDEVEIEGPHGAFFWRESREPHVLIAGGTGLAPMLSMLEQIRKLSGKRPPAILSFGCASPQNLFHLEELQARADWMPNLKVRVSVDRADASYTGVIGDPVRAITAADVVSAETVAYLCGPPPMIEAARAHLKALGVKPQNIHAEQFSASAQAIASS